MSWVDLAKRALRVTGLTSSAASILRGYAKLRPHHDCIRGGIRYRLDLSEVIDLGIFVGGWEPRTIGFLRRNVLAGQTVIEVGSNVGAHTLILARLVGPQGKVFGFEPTDYALAKLRFNLSMNPDLAKRVEIGSSMVTN